MVVGVLIALRISPNVNSGKVSSLFRPWPRSQKRGVGLNLIWVRAAARVALAGLKETLVFGSTWGSRRRAPGYGAASRAPDVALHPRLSHCGLSAL